MGSYISLFMVALLFLGAVFAVGWFSTPNEKVFGSQVKEVVKPIPLYPIFSIRGQIFGSR